jgi:hypothetical protein
MIRLFLLSFIFTAPVYSYTSPGGNWGLFEAEELILKPKKIWYYRNPYMQDYTTPRANERRYTADHPKNPDNPSYTGLETFEHWLYGVEFEFNLNLLRYKEQRWFFWDNRVYTYGTTNQVRHVGWDWDIGFTLLQDKLRVYYHHHSEHVMEQTRRNHDGYPLLDELVLELTFYKRKGK